MAVTKFSFSELKSFLDEKYNQYNRESFITTDPIQIPKAYTRKEDIEISAFLSASIAWGQRPTIIRNAKWLMERMDNKPLEFLMGATNTDFDVFRIFKHRTFNGDDCVFFLKSLQNIYQNHGGLEDVFACGFAKTNSIKGALVYFREVFFEVTHLHRSQKHIANVEKKSSAKRLNMFLRWMVRKDKQAVDFGLWNKVSPSGLFLPLDVHTGNVGRKLGLLARKQNDWAAVEEITNKLREFDANDPVKYDYALFGLGAFEKF